MRRLIPLLLTVSVACGQTDLTISAEIPINVSLGWRNAVAGDEVLRRVFDVERRQSLASGKWDNVASDNFTGIYTDSTPPEQSGFYRLRESAFALAISGPDSESISQGVRIVSPSGADVIFLKPREQITRNSPEPTNALTVVVNGAYRATIFYASGRQGSDFRYGIPGGRPSETLGLGGGEVELLAFSDGSLRLASPETLQAWSAAQEGARVAANEVTSLLTHFPDSATVWQNVGGPTTNEATVLYYRAKSQNTAMGASPADFGDDIAFFAKPLVSGAPAVPLSEIAESLPAAGGDIVNLNAVDPATAEPWIGTRSSALEDHPVTAARWVYVGAGGSVTNATNPAVARYAYWIEDESFRVNPAFMAAGAVDTNGMTPAEIRFLFTTNSAGLDLSRGGFKRFNINSVTNGISGPTDTANTRASLNRIIAAITNGNASPLFGQRFYRLTNGTTETINATNHVSDHHAQIYLQKIAANLLDYVDADNQPTVINNDAAFSIRTGRPSYGFDALGGGLDGTNSVAAMGVEAIPRLQEYAIHARIRSLRHAADNADSFGFVENTNGGNPTSANFEIWLDHYFEFWHPGTNIIRLNNAFLKIYDQPAFGPRGQISGPLGQAGRETSEIPLGNVTFRPGRTVVLTTARSGEVSSGANASQNGFALIDTTKMASAADVVSLNVPDADRKFTGTTTAIKQHVYNSQGNYGPSVFAGNTEPYNRLFEVNLLPRSTSITDYQSAVVIGNDNGVLESFVGLPIAASTAGTPAISLCVSNGIIREGMANLGAGNNDNVRGGSLRGNSPFTTTPSSTEGDPRALNEQLRFLNYASGMANTDQTRFYSTISSNRLPDGSTMGLPNTNYVNPARWVDVSSTEANATNAPLIVRNGPMQSIGELGHVTDPARVAGPGGIELARGGGRTLRIGQPEVASWRDSKQNTASRTWTSWRLTDLFSTKTNLQFARAVNPNGVLRDGGRTFGALFSGFTFLPAGPQGAQGVAGQQLQASNVVNRTRIRLTNASPAGLPSGSLNAFWEKGEISELSLFNSGTTLVGSVNMSNVIDRGREEVVRRTIEQITTRGSVFTSYVVAQSLSGTNTADTVRLKQTFRVEPQFAAAGAFDDAFNASNPASLAARFSAPTNFSSEVIYEELTSVEAP